MTQTATSWIELDVHAFKHNVELYKQTIGCATFAAVIKGNAYGHGQMLIAQLAEKNPNIDWLCVSNLSEALELRTHGIKKPILVLSCIDASLELAIRNNIAVIAYDLETLKTANQICEKLQRHLYVHLKIDTGLSRFGIAPHEVLAFIKTAQTFPWIIINGIFTHFAQSQQENQSYTINQYKKFSDLLQELHTNNITIPHRHCANTAAVTMVDAPECNFVRVGAGLYGLWPSEEVKKRALEKNPAMVKLQPILTWKTRIIALKEVPTDTCIGYDTTYTTTRPTKLAILPIGYHDGYDRRLSNCGKVMINNQIVPVIGRVCMNVAMIDVTDCPDVQMGDIVTLISDHPEISVSNQALLTKSYNARELLTKINPTVQRMIINADEIVQHSYKSAHQASTPIPSEQIL